MEKFYLHLQFFSSFVYVVSFFPHFHSCFCCLRLILISEIDFFPSSCRRYRVSLHFWLPRGEEALSVFCVRFFCIAMPCCRCSMMRNSLVNCFFISLLTRNITFFLHDENSGCVFFSAIYAMILKIHPTKKRIFIKYFQRFSQCLSFLHRFTFWDCFFCCFLCCWRWPELALFWVQVSVQREREW